MKWFYQHFPRQIAYPERITYGSSEQFFKMVNVLNGIKEELYGSIYNCDGEGHFTNTLIDKVGFDIDTNKHTKQGQDYMCKLLLKIHKILMKENLQHIFKFSTGGFWFYVFTDDYLLVKHPKDALRNVHNHIAKLCELSIGEPEIADLDFHIIGDHARISRIWNSYVPKRKRFVIPVTVEDIQKGYDHILKKAKQQCFKFKIYGTKKLKMGQFDYLNRNALMVDIPDDEERDFKLKDTNMFVQSFPPCVQRMIVSQDWKGWFYATVYMKEVEGMLPQQIDSVMKQFLEKTCKPSHKRWGNDYLHYRKHDHFPEVVFRRDLDFPRCDNLFNAYWNNVNGEKKFCKGKCPFFMTFYKGDQERSNEIII